MAFLQLTGGGGGGAPQLVEQHWCIRGCGQSEGPKRPAERTQACADRPESQPPIQPAARLQWGDDAIRVTAVNQQ